MRSAACHQSGDNATHPIAQLAGRLAALLVVAGADLRPPRALPASLQAVHWARQLRLIKPEAPATGALRPAIGLFRSYMPGHNDGT